MYFPHVTDYCYSINIYIPVYIIGRSDRSTVIPSSPPPSPPLSLFLGAYNPQKHPLHHRHHYHRRHYHPPTPTLIPRPACYFAPSGTRAGPKIKMRYGRIDTVGPSECAKDGNLPDPNAPFGDASPDASTHLRNVFHRMGFSDQEIVALSGAHTIGR